MKAIAITKFGKAEEALETLDKLKPTCGNNEVLVKVSSFGINFADILARKGLYGGCPPLPAVVGYEAVGFIEEVGTGVTDLKVGQRVLAFTRFGAYAEYVSVPTTSVIPIDNKITDTEATALATQYSTAYYATNIISNLIEGETVLIHSAAGGVGTALVQLAKLKGCKVIGTVSTKNKYKILEDLGVDQIINSSEQDFETVLKQQKTHPDVIFDAIGGKKTKKGLKLLAFGGRMVVYGASSRSKGGFLAVLKLLFGYGFYTPARFIVKSQSIIGVNMLRIADHRTELVQKSMQKVFELYQQGKLKVIADKSFDASNIAEAHNYIESRKSIGKVSVKW